MNIVPCPPAGARVPRPGHADYTRGQEDAAAHVRRVIRVVSQSGGLFSYLLKTESIFNSFFNVLISKDMGKNAYM